jgi:Na+-translocating ferredoxin:NAD+ oxidoreductase RnfE subunit
MEENDEDALPGWWIAGVALTIILGMVLFGLAVAQDSLGLGFASVLVLLLAYPVLAYARRRFPAKEKKKP